MKPKIESLVPGVERTIRHYLRGVPQHVDQDALRGAAYEALNDAYENYDEHHLPRPVRIESFVWSRVWGAMTDELRRTSNWSRRTKTVTAETVSIDREVVQDETLTILDMISNEHSPDPESSAFSSMFLAQIMELPRRQAVAILAPLVGVSLREVGDMFGVTESRACQLASQGRRNIVKKHRARRFGAPKVLTR